ncbi:uncharacterized protein EV422DRAFT_513797 [Fimicolochytrium jonesii]|uniref:uncharacterized protein n=1 Tax=Fimicolochytrium jonesii TaxID=1396493 RepID=UPI0022FDC4B1|nr:uncharacterized protein EV422DRAFT_513797 [Fimicolochytrium jonesii]KAI8825673.1 hypothetical protein EV422DRAFT_513797 [Fimicolochytrium jonesii]
MTPEERVREAIRDLCRHHFGQVLQQQLNAFLEELLTVVFGVRDAFLNPFFPYGRLKSHTLHDFCAATRQISGISPTLFLQALVINEDSVLFVNRPRFLQRITRDERDHYTHITLVNSKTLQRCSPVDAKKHADSFNSISVRVRETDSGHQILVNDVADEVAAFGWLLAFPFVLTCDGAGHGSSNPTDIPRLVFRFEADYEFRDQTRLVQAAAWVSNRHSGQIISHQNHRDSGFRSPSESGLQSRRL